MKKSNWLVAGLLIVAFLFRASLSPYINKGDILVMEEWSRNLYEKGLPGSYFREGWVYSFPTQPPLMMLFYWLSRWLYENRYVLAITHNLIKFPPAAILLWLAANGPFFFIRLWGILADCASGLLVYLLLKQQKKKETLALSALIFLVFNPITIFISSIWGQVDLLACFLSFASFFVFYKRWGKFTSPLFYVLAIMVKPTVLLLLPLYLIFIFRESFLSPANKKTYFIFPILGVICSALIIFGTFFPFWDRPQTFSSFLNSVLTRRILPSAKGVSKVATSGYTFFTVFFDIDRTLGNYRVVLTLDQWGQLFFIGIIFATGLMMFKKREPFEKEINHLCFLAYFIAEGTFLFRTNMAERYFLPAFLFLYLLFFLIKSKSLRIAILIQMFLWFINLSTSFFLSDSHWLDVILRQNNYWGTRVLSFFNLLIFMFIVNMYFKKERS